MLVILCLTVRSCLIVFFLEDGTLCIPSDSQAPLFPYHSYNFKNYFVITVLIDVWRLDPEILFEDICSAMWATGAIHMSTLTVRVEGWQDY